jgi:hypothetical protein
MAIEHQRWIRFLLPEDEVERAAHLRQGRCFQSQ